MAIYESEHTKFMREWLRKHPEQIQEAKKGRALWWNRPQRQPDTQGGEYDARVPQKSYYYDAN